MLDSAHSLSHNTLKFCSIEHSLYLILTKSWTLNSLQNILDSFVNFWNVFFFDALETYRETAMLQ